jgi:hypothetical protein
MSELKELLSPSALPVLILLAALAVAFVRFERAKKDMIGIIAEEVKRRGTPEPLPVSLKSPFIVSADDPPVKVSACTLHMQAVEGRVTEVRCRLDRIEGGMREDVKRIHERIDEIPARVIALLGDTKSIHSRSN